MPLLAMGLSVAAGAFLCLLGLVLLLNVFGLPGNWIMLGLILLYCGPKDERGFAAMHAGSMYQNVGLMCASLGLANCVKWQKHDALDRELPLPKGWQTFITHSIGKPAA